MARPGRATRERFAEVPTNSIVSIRERRGEHRSISVSPPRAHSIAQAGEQAPCHPFDLAASSFRNLPQPRIKSQFDKINRLATAKVRSPHEIGSKKIFAPDPNEKPRGVGGPPAPSRLAVLINQADLFVSAVVSSSSIFRKYPFSRRVASKSKHKVLGCSAADNQGFPGGCSPSGEAVRDAAAVSTASFSSLPPFPLRGSVLISPINSASLD